MNDRIHLLTAAGLSFPFSDGATRPSYRQNTRFGWGSSVFVDPFPCYAHDLVLVERCVEAVERAFPIGCPPLYFVLSHETEARTNGWCAREGILGAAQKAKARSPFEAIITLAGKRIPIHPAMTRYLVAHEYGHAVQTWCEHTLGLYDKHDEKENFLRDYAKVRGCEFSAGYGGGRWHSNTGEIFANDFRILVAGAEEEFWPHEVAHPRQCPAIIDHWRTVLQPMAFAEPVAAEPAA